MKNKFFAKAKENLRASQILFDNDLFNASVNRAYYAAYQAAIAGLANIGITNPKNDHKWVQATFNRELINRRKKYPSKFRSYLVDMQTNRNQADYTEEFLGKKLAKQQFRNAKEFVKTIEKGLNI